MDSVTAGGVSNREIATGEVLISVPLSSAFVVLSDDASCPFPAEFVDPRCILHLCCLIFEFLSLSVKVSGSGPSVDHGNHGSL